MEIREARERDFIRINELNREALGYNYPVERTWERLLLILRRSEDRIFVACEDDNVIGYLHAADYECTYLDSMKNVMALAVDARFRGRGAGRALLEAAERWARDSGSLGIRVQSALHREGAHEFYRRCGYEENGTKKTFVKHFT